MSGGPGARVRGRRAGGGALDDAGHAHGRVRPPNLGSGPASGKPVALTYLDHYRIVGGQIAEVWEVRDGLSLQEQFGLVAAQFQFPGAGGR